MNARHLLLLALGALSLSALGACSTLPRDGPSNRAITGAADASKGATFALIDLTYEESERIRLAPAMFTGSLTGTSEQAVTDIIAIGDTLSVSVLTPGGSLFGGGGGAPGPAAAGAAAPTGSSSSLPPLVVDRSGAVPIPFSGVVHVAGLTPEQAGQAIRASLRGKAINPQVIVAIASSPLNGVTVFGSVNTPGRVSVVNGANSIVDVIAQAGGVSGPPENIIVDLTRGGRTVSAPLSRIFLDPNEDVSLLPGDRVNLVSRPRRYSSFGALGAVTLTEMPTGDTTLTGALSALGGLANDSANARAVLVFRFERTDIARSIGVTQPETRKGVPVIYRLNLEQPQGFFTANNFLIQAEDVIYVPRADSAELRKFFEFVQSITRIVYDVSVTSALGGN
jgi:polysaccharide export outer membrane protein